MSDNDGSGDGEQPKSPQRLIYEAHRNAARERERVTAAPYVDDHVIHTQFAEVDYHAAVLEYFSRLKAHLVDRPEFWDEVPLYNEPLDGQRKQLAQQFAEYYGIERHKALQLFDALEESDNFKQIQPREDETVRGLKNLVHWRGRTETVTEVEDDPIDGSYERTYEKPIHLPRDVALRAHDALEAAAVDLGFNVRPGDELVKTHLDGETREYTVEGVTNQ